ncbi:MAG: LacI family DNA-binding transcriptional regulator [Acidimicrobiales bacterium]|jgi:DNA-binding LacI/PurR family transcriptional regulator
MAEAENSKRSTKLSRASFAARRTTIEMVAEHAGVSRQTVSNAYNAPDRLRPATLRTVLAAIEELGYRPSQAARSLRTDATHVIGCRLLPSNYGGTGGVLDGWFHALCDAARSNGYNILTFAASTDDDEIAIYDDLLRRRAVDGFVLTNTHHADARPAAIAELGARCVAFGRPWGIRRPQHSWVDVDGASGTSEAVRYLADLGHTRIGFLGVDEGSGVGDDRCRGWQRTMETLGLSTKGMVARAADGIASGRALAQKLLDSSRPPTAFVSVSDAMAVGAMHAVEDRGGRPGRDVSVVGFDDSPIASVIRPGLSSIRQPIETVAARLIELLLAELNDAQHHASRVLLKPHLIVRESSGERGGRAKPTGELSMKRSGRAQLAQGARKKVSATPESNGTKGRDEGI